MFVWDPTKAAPSHSALAGVLAGIVLAVLAILIQSEVSADPSLRASYLDRLSTVFKNLILALFTLTVSAVIWGGLAGDPSAVEISAASSEVDLANVPGSADGHGLATDASQVVRAVQALEMTRATSAVLGLTIGALLFVASMMALIPPAMYASSELATYIGRAFALLAALGAYEIGYFAWSAARICFPELELPHPSLMGFATFGLVGVLTLPVGSERVRSRVTRRLPPPHDPDRCINGFAAAASLVAVVGYMLGPSANYATEAEAFSTWHQASAVVVGAAAVLSIVFLVVTDWILFSLSTPKTSS